jgi:hypothetical protein
MNQNFCIIVYGNLHSLLLTKRKNKTELLQNNGDEKVDFTQPVYPNKHPSKQFLS